MQYHIKLHTKILGGLDRMNRKLIFPVLLLSGLILLLNVNTTVTANNSIIPSPNQIVNSIEYLDGWISLKNISFYHQTTNYTCGPSSLKIALSNYGMNLNEMELAKYAHTTRYDGTTHTGLINALKQVNTKYKTHYHLNDVNFSSTGWNGLRNHLIHNEPVILHIQSFLKPNLTGHYVVLIGINMNEKLVKIVDPSSDEGYRILTFNQLKTRMDWIVNTGRANRVILPLTR